MGSKKYKAERNDASRLCKERMRFIKQAIDSRYNLAAAHVSYINSLKNIGIQLRRFAEAEIVIESSLSEKSAATELDKTPSHSSYPSPSPSHIVEVSDSPLHSESPISAPVVNISHMKVGGHRNTLTFKVNLKNNDVDDSVEDESFGFPMPMPPPPPPPPFESGGSWDYFDASDHGGSFSFVRHNELDVDFNDARGWNGFRVERVVTPHDVKGAKAEWARGGVDGNRQMHRVTLRPRFEEMSSVIDGNMVTQKDNYGLSIESNAPSMTLSRAEGSERQVLDSQVRPVEIVLNGNSSAVEHSACKMEKQGATKDSCTEREDPSEFITHRAKDFLSSIKDIEHRFFRASESGKEVARMLEANSIWVGYSKTKRKSSALELLSAFRRVCCRAGTTLVSDEPVENTTKVITWKRTTSSRSSSSRNPLVAATKDDISDVGSDFMEEFCMIAGSHSSTLDRLYAWERKLYDEVKASESVRKEYDRKCEQLRKQFTRDLSTQKIDKVRAILKDLHSQIRVAILSVDSISKRIENMRDEELQPQLLELIQGLIRMWKSMLECHHAQYITISLAYHSRSTPAALHGDTHRQIMVELQGEIECFGLSFVNSINSLVSYVEALNGWLQHCIMQPQERSKSKKPFSPRRVLAPPIFVVCRDWAAGIKALQSEELSNAIKAFSSDLCHLIERQADQLEMNKTEVDARNGESEGKDDEKYDDVLSCLYCIHASLIKVLDRLNKFSEASLKMYEDIRQEGEAARMAYMSCKPPRY